MGTDVRRWAGVIVVVASVAAVGAVAMRPAAAHDTPQPQPCPPGTAVTPMCYLTDPRVQVTFSPAVAHPGDTIVGTATVDTGALPAGATNITFHWDVVGGRQGWTTSYRVAYEGDQFDDENLPHSPNSLDIHLAETGSCPTDVVGPCSRFFEGYFTEHGPLWLMAGGHLRYEFRDDAGVMRIGFADAEGLFQVAPGERQQPVAAFTTTQTGHTTIRFDASASTAPGGSIVEYQWVFGDGTTATTAEPVIEHTYAEQGRYFVRLFVVDNTGGSGFTERFVDVFGLRVNSLLDRSDADLGDGSCDTGVDIDGGGTPECTLRAAIEQANDRTGTDTIMFDLPTAQVPVIAPLAPLPRITDEVTIDGTTQPASKRVAIAGGVASGPDGLTIEAEDVVVKGLAIGGFPGAGVMVTSTAARADITDTWLGLSGAGAPLGNGNGVVVDGAADVRIGQPGGGNVISGNDIGVVVRGDASGATIAASRIGLLPAADTAAPNRIGVAVIGAQGTTVGGAAAGMGNVVAGNQFVDVLVGGIGAVGGTTVAGNLIGVTAGGATFASGFGVYLDGFANPVTGTVVEDNTIAGHEVDVELVHPGATGNRVRGNRIGTNPAGTAVAPPPGGNQRAGVRIDGAPGNFVGEAGDGNRIAGHTFAEILIYGDVNLRVVDEQVVVTYPLEPLPDGSAATGSGTEVAGNTIGTLVGGTRPPSQVAGVMVSRGADDTTIGPGNAIAPMTASVWLFDVERARVRGNVIGDPDITPSSSVGVLMSATDRSTIGGRGQGDGNRIGGVASGVALGGGIGISGDVVAEANEVLGNTIGGSAGAVDVGVSVGRSAEDTIVGDVGAGNAITAANLAGVSVDGFVGNGVSAPTGTVIQDNTITSSVEVAVGMRNEDGTTVRRNTIEGGQIGVAVNTGTRTQMSRNSITATSGRAIDIAPLGLNPLTGIDPSLNGGIGTPVLTAAGARQQAATTRLAVALPAGPHTLEVFDNDGCRSNGGPDAQRFAASVLVTGTGAAQEVDIAGALTVGHGVTVTVTDGSGHTSEVSDCVVVEPLDDADRDGVNDDTEDSGPGGGDANGDGIPDKEQPHVATFLATTGQYVTMVAASGLKLAGVTPGPNPSPGDAPAGVAFPAGFVDFRIEGLQPGGGATIDVLLPAGTATTWWQYGPRPGAPTQWYEFAFDGTTGTEMIATGLRLHFLDGGRGDHDQVANGVITDPGAPATSGELEVDIDISPKQSPNLVVPGSFTLVAVAVVTTGTFDASTLARASLRFGRTGTEARPLLTLLWDADRDGDRDLVAWFIVGGTGIRHGDTVATLTGVTRSGRPVHGSDAIVTVRFRGRW